VCVTTQENKLGSSAYSFTRMQVWDKLMAAHAQCDGMKGEREGGSSANDCQCVRHLLLLISTWYASAPYPWAWPS